MRSNKQSKGFEGGSNERKSKSLSVCHEFNEAPPLYPMTRIQVTHPVEVGVFGRFKYGGEKLVSTWIALEEVAYEMGVEWGNAQDLVDWAETMGLLIPAEIEMFEKAL